jgi:hypothetical protein
MALTDQQKRVRNAAYQARWRAKREALARGNPEMVERGLMQEAERSEQLPDGERIALADRLADVAMGHLRRAQEIARVAQRVRLGER